MFLSTLLHCTHGRIYNRQPEETACVDIGLERGLACVDIGLERGLGTYSMSNRGVNQLLNNNPANNMFLSTLLHCTHGRIYNRQPEERACVDIGLDRGLGICSMSNRGVNQLLNNNPANNMFLSMLLHYAHGRIYN
ncbi:hypothetical protein J6590_009395 [Homalodisca vitripennis]|nr:hypothetical protein J6590_009395 [Homalodisca vitripennis]